MSQFLHTIFLFLARLCILRHRPYVIGVTGSYGKTTLRNLITDILREAWQDVWTPEGNYNGEWGFPLAVLQVRSGGKSVIGWTRALFGALKTIFSSQYPKTLVLEYGIDHVGEMAIQTRIVEPDIAIFTTLSPSHIEGFGTEEAYFHEKSLLLSRKKKNTFAIGNSDDPHQVSFNCDVWYGHAGTLQFRHIRHHIDHVDFDLDFSLSENTSFPERYVRYARSLTTTLSTRILDEHIIPLIGWAGFIGYMLGVDPPQLISIVSTLDVPHGRGNVLQGICDSCIIDGTYNGGFDPIVAGVQSMVARGTGQQKIALLGDMRELGSIEVERHQELWKILQSLDIDYVVFVGDISQRIIGPMIEEDDIHRVRFFTDSREAGKFIRQLIIDSDQTSIVFAKGSQNTIYLEEALKYIIISEEAGKLVRQDLLYMRKKRDFFRRFN